MNTIDLVQGCALWLLTHTWSVIPKQQSLAMKTYFQQHKGHFESIDRMAVYVLNWLVTKGR